MDDSGRYSRQERFGQFGPQGQERLGRSSAVLVGCGALGSLQAELLVRAGLGRLRILDRDFVELSNLQRQTLFTEEDALHALPKAATAQDRLQRINSQVQVEGLVIDVVASNVEDLLGGFDLILDGTDNFDVHYLINDVAVKTGRPWIYGGCVGAYGVSMTIRPGVTACLACLMPEPPVPGSTPTCDTAGILGPAAAAVACRQVGEALKLLSGNQEALQEGLMSLDLWKGTQQVVQVRRSEDCPVCVERAFRHLEGKSGKSLSTTLCGRNAVQITPASALRCDLPALSARLATMGDVVSNPFLIRASVGEYHLTVFLDGRAIIVGTEDPGVARRLYAQYVGH